MERLVELCQTPAYIGYAVRLYVGSNSLQDLGDQRQTNLLDEAFMFHLKKGVGCRLDFSCGATKFCGTPKSPIKGNRFVCRHNIPTKALKYLACCGLACPVEISSGIDFENLVSLYYSRLTEMQGKKFLAWSLKVRDLVLVDQARLRKQDFLVDLRCN